MELHESQSQSQSQSQNMGYSNHFDEVARQIDSRGPVFEEFIRRAVVGHPELSEVSWSVYDKIKYTGPKAYVKVRNIPLPFNQCSSHA